jgi:uncharacterized protein
MEAIYIPHLLKAPRRTVEFQFEEFFPGLETLTPVRGYLCVTYKTTFLDVRGRAEAIVTLTCDRCLRQYNHRLKIDTSEPLWLDAAADRSEGAEEVEVAFEDLVETLSPNGHFDPGDWLYQQLCLALPQRQLCEGPCEPPKSSMPDSADSGIDRRWAALEALKQQLSG